MADTSGFVISLKDGNKKVTITNTGVDGVVIELEGSTRFNYGFGGDIETLSSDFAMQNDDFIKFVNALDVARDQIKDKMARQVKKVVLTSDIVDKPKKAPTKKPTKKATKKAKK